jgi:hypothetical protein
LRKKRAERIDQRAMAGSVEQSALIVLAVDFDKPARDAAQELCADGLVVDARARAPVGQLPRTAAIAGWSWASSKTAAT